MGDGAMNPIDSLVIDLSNYDWDTFDARAFYVAGVRRAIVGSQRPSLSGQMVDALRSEGIEIIGAYELPYFGSDDTTIPQAERLAKFVTDYRIPLAWCDAEIDANQTNVPEWRTIPTPSVKQRIGEFARFVDIVRKAVPAGVYTNAGWWKPNMANSPLWSHLPLWLPTYGYGGSAIDPIVTVDFGGWTAPMLHQYTSTHVINGRVRDMSYLFGEVAREDEMTADEIRALVEAETDKRVTALFNAGAPPFFRHYVDLAINPVAGGFTDPTGALLPAIENAQTRAHVEALDTRVAALEARAPVDGVPAHTHVPGGVA